MLRIAHELTILEGDAEVARYDLAPGLYTLGRSAECELWIEADGILPVHARISVAEDGAIAVSNCEGSPPLLVNGSPLESDSSALIAAGANVGVTASVSLRFSFGPAIGLAGAEPGDLPRAFLEQAKFQVKRTLAEGEHRTLLVAEETRLRRQVVMRTGGAVSGATEDERLIAEACIAGQLEHPNIVPVHYLGTGQDGRPFYTMKLVKGITLRKILELLRFQAAGPLRKYPLPALLVIFQKVCDGVALAHAKGILHCRLEPKNIMVGGFGEVVVMAWGGAVAVPEACADAEEEGKRDDIFALGTIFYEILTLRALFSEGEAGAMLARARAGESVLPPRAAVRQELSPRAHLPGGRVPEALSEIAMRALSTAPHERYRSVRELQKDLEAYQNGFATSTERRSAWKQLKVAVKRHRKTFVATVVVCVVAAALGANALIASRGAVREAARAQGALRDLRQTAPALLHLAEGEARLQHFDEARDAASRALSIDAAAVEAYWRRAWSYVAQSRWNEASAALAEARQHDPRNEKLAGLLPLVHSFIDARSAAAQNVLLWRIGRHLRQVGATGESVPSVVMVRTRALADVKNVAATIARLAAEGTLRTSDVFTAKVDDDLVRVDLHGNAAPLQPLQGLPIGQLVVAGDNLLSLEPLRGMPLTKLSVANNAGLASLAGLEGMPLEIFEATSDPQIRDLEPLRGAPLRKLLLSWVTGPFDLTPLKGAPLEELGLAHTGATGFAALRGMPLRRLHAYSTQFRDASVLAGMPLTELILNDTPIADLGPLSLLPLKVLNVRNTPVRDFRPLVAIKSLTDLECNPPDECLAPLEKHPSLRFINSQPVAEFWAAYSGRHPAAAK